MVAGQGSARVTDTGERTEFGLIGSAIGQLRDARSPLQRDTRWMAQIFGAVGPALGVVVVLSRGLLTGGWIDGVLRELALAMAILPEEFPLVITVFLTLGAWRPPPVPTLSLNCREAARTRCAPPA